MINPNVSDQDSAFREIESWMKNLSENGGNYVRIWLSASFWDMEHEKAGEYDPEKVRRIDWFVEKARKYGLHIKMTLEHFRSVTLEENPQRWATKFIYHTSSGGPLDSIRQYLTSEAGHKLFLDKLDFYQERYGSDTIFFGWELWNEMNAMKGPEDSIFLAWNKKMLKETKKRFPENLVMQSLGSFDRESVRPTYRKMMSMPENEIAQIHRYLDLGANMEICHAPMDIITSSAIDELLSYNLDKPSILAETGGVEPRHTGPIRYYKLDTAGMLLHDVLFAPFFSGSAGVGMNWHWNQYVHPNNLWYHFGRFAEAINGINPIREKFVPEKYETERLRIYLLRGEKRVVLWCRDKKNTWKTELEEGLPPEAIRHMTLDLEELNCTGGFKRIRSFDPWKNKWTNINRDSSRITMPVFYRSMVISMD
jgi:hypothetical protein